MLRPRTLLEHLRKYSVYRRALLSYLALSAITVVIVSGVLFFAFGRRSTQDITESGEAILEQTARAIDLLNEQVRTVGNALIEEETVVASLRSTQVDRLREYHTNLVFTSVRTVYPFIRFVGLYNGTTDRYVNTEGMTSAQERDFLDWVLDAGPMLFFSSFVRPVDYAYPRTSDSGAVVSFVLRPDLRLQRANESFILVNVELEYVGDLISSLSGGFGGNVIVASESGDVVVAGSDPRFANTDFVAGLLDKVETNATGTFPLRHDGRRFVVTHARSPELGWTLFGLRALSDILSNSFTLAWIALGTAAAIIVLGALLSAAFTRRIYDPLSRLVNEVGQNNVTNAMDSASGERINEYEVLSQAYTRFAARVGLLEGALDDDLPLLRRTYIHSVLMGTRVELPDNAAMAARVVAGTEAGLYAVSLCRVDRLGEFRRTRSAESISNLMLLVSRSCHDALSDLGVAIPMILEGDEIAIFIGGDSLRMTAIVDRLRETQVRIGRQAGCTVSCSVSSIQPERDLLHDSLLEARRLLRYRFFSGPSSVVFAGQLPPRTAGVVPFPAEPSRRLVECLKTGLRDEAVGLLGQFQRSIRENSYQGSLALYHQLSVELLAEFEHLELFAPEEFAAHHAFVEDLSTVEFADDADRAVETLCETIFRVHASAATDKTQELIRQAMEYVRTNYADANLSLDSTASALQVSAGHMGRVFADHSDTYLSDYINQVRIDHAKSLLTETDMTIHTIAESVGVTNSTYFFTLFKKHVGITPARYRRSTQAV